MVTTWIAQTHKAMPDLKANDKYPNIDGYIELVDSTGLPTGTLKVQVKKLSVKNAKKLKHGFKDNKFLDYCKNSSDWLPIIFIGVDFDKKCAYWVHIDKHFVNSLKGSKTITFNKNQVISNSTTIFIDDWQKISQLYNTMAVEFERYKKAFSMLSGIITPALGKSDPKFIDIHDFLDYYNYFLDYQFPVVKKVFYPRSWKIGFAYYQYGSKILSYTLYPIPIDKNDVQIKEVDRGIHAVLENEGLGFVTHFSQNPIIENPKNYAKKVVGEKIKKIIEKKLLIHSGNKFLATEFIFAFLDKFHTQLGLEKKDVYRVEEIEEGFYKYFPLWMEEALKIDSSFLKSRDGYLDPDLMTSFLREDRLEEIKKSVLKRIISGKTKTSAFPVNNRNIPFKIFVELLGFLRRIELVSINRPYADKNFERIKGGYSGEVFSKKDAEKNFKTMFRNLLEAYNVIIKNNFPLLSKELSIFGESDTLLVSCSVKDQYKGGGAKRLPKLQNVFFEIKKTKKLKRY